MTYEYYVPDENNPGEYVDLLSLPEQKQKEIKHKYSTIFANKIGELLAVQPIKYVSRSEQAGK